MDLEISKQVIKIKESFVQAHWLVPLIQALFGMRESDHNLSTHSGIRGPCLKTNKFWKKLRVRDLEGSIPRKGNEEKREGMRNEAGRHAERHRGKERKQ